jgi:protein phosphatase
MTSYLSRLYNHTSTTKADLSPAALAVIEKDHAAAAKHQSSKYNNLEALEEDLAMQAARMSELIIQKLGAETGVDISMSVDKLRQARQGMKAKADPPVSPRSQGKESSRMKLEPPYSPAVVRDVLTGWASSPEPQKLHKESVLKLLKKFKEVYSKTNGDCVMKRTVPEGGQLVIVGDTHGQLDDILWIFTFQGPPSAKQHYLINGDMVDRGPNSVEVLLSVYLMFLAYPEYVMITRGNHEDPNMNHLTKEQGGGFYQDVLRAYSAKIYDNFAETFKVLTPMWHITNAGVAVMHGGIPRPTFKLPQIAQVPWQNAVLMAADVGPKGEAFNDLLWSDPKDDPGWERSQRGAGIAFGPDITAAFCQEHGLKCIVRSHQLPLGNRGFEKQHDDQCWTIFSASNYSGEVGNYGAVLVVTMGANGLEIQPDEYWAPPRIQFATQLQQSFSIGAEPRALLKNLETTAQSKHAEEILREEEGKMGPMTVRKMIRLLVESLPVLYSRFQAMDKDGTTKLPRREVCDVLDEVCGKSDWEKVIKYWGISQKIGKKFVVDYDEFLTRFRVEINASCRGWMGEIMDTVFDKLMADGEELTQVVKKLDKNGDGIITPQEFKDFLGTCNLGLSEPQLQKITDIASGGKSQVNAAEFLTRFVQAKLSTEEALKVTQVQDQWAELAVASLARFIWSTGSHETLLEIFRAYDASGDGMLSEEEIVKGLMSMPNIDKLRIEGKAITANDIRRIFRHMDSSGDGSLSYFEFIAKCDVQDSDSKSLDNAIISHITTTLYRYRTPLLAACEFFDADFNGTIETSEFAHAMRVLGAVIQEVGAESHPPFSEAQIEGLANGVTQNAEVDYLNFFDSFQIVDVTSKVTIVDAYMMKMGA